MSRRASVRRERLDKSKSAAAFARALANGARAGCEDGYGSKELGAKNHPKKKKLKYRLQLGALTPYTHYIFI